MKALANVFYTSPYILMGLVLILIYTLTKSKGKMSKLNLVLVNITVILAASTFIYYAPTHNIFKKYSIESISVIAKGKEVTAVMDKETIDKIVKVLNNHSFIKSSAKTLNPENLADDTLITLNLFDKKTSKPIFLYLMNSHKKNILEINEQVYDESDMEGLNKDVMNTLFELKLLNSADYGGTNNEGN